MSQLDIHALGAGVELSDLRNLLLHVCPEIRVNLGITCNDGDVHVFPPWCAAGILARGWGLLGAHCPNCALSYHLPHMA